MSYSRWSYSTWYTFWASLGEGCEFKFPTKKLKHKQTFEICDFPSYYITYGELMENGLLETLDDVKRVYTHGGVNAKNPTEDELDELGVYLLEFVKDVDEHFEWGNFFRYEWYYPLRNKILNWSWFR